MQVKFLTLNLFEGGLLFPAIKEFLRRENFDILCFQEVYNGKNPEFVKNLRTMDVLSSLLPGFHSCFSAEFLEVRKEGKVAVGNAIFSRFPLEQITTTFFDIPYKEIIRDEAQTDFSQETKNLLHARILLGTVPIDIFDVHGIWGLDGLDTPRRLAMSQTIIAEIKEKEQVILAGDFNVKPETQTIRNIERYLTNIFAGELTSTFNMKHKTNPGYATAVVDMVFASRQLKSVKQYSPNDDVSDHLPLVVTFEIT